MLNQSNCYPIEQICVLAEVLHAEEIIDSTFFQTYMPHLDELDKHRAVKDEPGMAEEAKLDPQFCISAIGGGVKGIHECRVYPS